LDFLNVSLQGGTGAPAPSGFWLGLEQAGMISHMMLPVDWGLPGCKKAGALEGHSHSEAIGIGSKY